MKEFAYLFHQGTQYRAYEFMGAHFTEEEGKKGVRFSVWAPSAVKVSIEGDFNGWNKSSNYMSRISDGGLFTAFIEGVKEYDCYKYCIYSDDGIIREKCDPYGYHSETRPANASKVYELEGYEWNDGKWREYVKGINIYKSPMNIYEVHAGSWKRKSDGSFYSYIEMADEMIPYAKKLGYTHIELMPISEYPLDDSWGYQVTGYYAVTSRMGTPKDLMYFIDMCHQNGLGVILDWVPAHFPKDEIGLYMFDGHPCYEYADPLKGEHREWGTMVFDFGKTEVQSFLVSNAIFWFDKFHIDGLRTDAVASMLYLDYGRNDGQWTPNSYGGKENLEAIAFLRKLNTEVFARYPYAIMAAEESTAWPMVTSPACNGGLGFNFKWNMGWMNDTLRYFTTDPLFRRYCHENLTFSMGYAFSENYILPISHDEIVYGKKSLINKMPGNYEEKFAGMRSFLAYMTAFPGKKLLFMSSEFAQFDEWNFNTGIEMEIMDYDYHRMMFEYVAELNCFYLDNKALWEGDTGWNGFEWVAADDRDTNIVAFFRFADDGSALLCIMNFAPVMRENYYFGLPEGKYKQVFSSDETRFGGSGIDNGIITTVNQHYNGYDYSASIDIPPNSGMFFKKLY